MKYSNKIILVDFGATRIKSVLVDAKSGNIIDAQEQLSPSGQRQLSPPYFAVAIDEYYQAYLNTVGKLSANYSDIQAVYICSEMHGFALREQDKFTDYVSWKDSRVDVQDHIDQSSWFLSTTGMKLRTGLPYLNLQSVAQPSKQYKFYTLVDAVLELAGCTNIKTDYSLATSTGLVDINQKIWSKDLYKVDTITFNPLNKDLANPIANRGAVRFYGGIGDLQAAVLGCGINQDSVINLGTGSQVITKQIKPGTELRPYLDNYLGVITHIPSGRALNHFADLFFSITQDKTFFWNHWNQLDSNDIVNAEPTVDLNLFEAAWQYTGNAHVRLKEGRSHFRDLLADIARSWLDQYLKALDVLSVPNNQVIVSGGLAKSSFVVDSLNKLDSKRTYRHAQCQMPEETLEGLYNLYKINENSSYRS